MDSEEQISVDFTTIYNDEEINRLVVDVLESKRYVKGPVVEEFEQRFADYCGTDHAVAVSNGTAAILLSLKAAGVTAGHEVFVPAHTYFATVSPVLEIGATPRFVDINPNYYTMDPDALRRAVDLADDPEAIVVTHMHGQPAAMNDIAGIADEFGLTLIEDAAQAHGATHAGRTVGGIGDLGCFSFYPSKNMTVGGDGGMVTTDDAEFSNRIRAYRNHGRNGSGDHVRLGLNFRLDETNGAVGLVQLKYLDEWNAARREAATAYTTRLQQIEEVTVPSIRPDADHVFHHYPVQVPDREAFRAHLDQANVDTAVHYEKAVHEHSAVANRVDDKGQPLEAPFETATDLCQGIVSLPMHPRLTETEIEYVFDVVQEYYR